MNIFVITPPLVQLNSPYPSGAYLKAFFKKNGHEVIWEDLSIELFYSIFSSQGLKKLFELSTKKAIKLSLDAQNSGDDATAFNIRRYISLSENWISWIDWIVAILCDGNKTVSGREKEHEFLYSPFAPRGNRMETFLSSMDREPTVDDVRYLCTLALADLADYITIVFDNNFSLIRYAEALTVDQRSFAEIEKNLDSPVLKTFYLPVLESFLNKYSDSLPDSRVCISIPFAGTFVPALFTARFFKQKLGDKVQICIGGGFVNTELRDAKDQALKNYIDVISYDRGYGSYKALDDAGDKTKISLYKSRQFFADSIIEPEWSNLEYEKYETKITAEIVPDYSDIDFSRYPRVCDDKNPMHRLWTDGAWIKAYLAHGCYWHKCAFCDTNLDYVCGYKPVNVKNLYDGLLETAQKKGVYGIHFVDEALPPKMLKEFSLMNCHTEKKRLYFWGNVRFEKSFTKDLAAFLAYGGLGGVSAGLEVATGEGLVNINKGTDIESIVSACAAFKEAGILVHAYMIYGFWNDTPQSIINSMETLRQFFEAGLLDSAFWHKFVLTRNSTVYTEWEKGLHPELKPIFSSKNKSDSRNIFANNNLNFEGENKYNKFGAALDTAVNSWMHGEKLQMKVQKWFDFQVPAPTIPQNYVEKLIEKYERSCNQYYQKCTLNENGLGEQLYWLGGKTLVFGNSLTWIYLQEEFVLNEPKIQKKLYVFTECLENLRPDVSDERRKSALKEISSDKDFLQLLRKLRGKGLVLV